jgi:hypothetical protein
MIEYADFPELAGLFLEDSYVLDISESPRQLVFKLDAVLTPEHPAYRPPRPGEQHCYTYGTLVFGDVTRVEWLRRSSRRHTDASGAEDLGNIDILTVRDGAFIAEGDWGRVRVLGGRPSFEVG